VAYIYPEDIGAAPFQMQRAGKRLVKSKNRDNWRMSIRARRAWPLAAWVFFVLLVSLLPLPLKQSLQTHGRFHNTAHFLAFLITVLLVCWNKGSNAGVAVACTGAIVVAFFTEGAQTAIYHNLFEWDDVLVDSLGAITGGVFFLAYRVDAQSRGKKVICKPTVKSCSGGPTTGRK
jgi:VanZ family protein